MLSEEGQRLQAGPLPHQENQRSLQAGQTLRTEDRQARFHAVQAELQHMTAAILHRTDLHTAEALLTTVHLTTEAHHRAEATLHLAGQATAPVHRAEATAEAAREEADTAEAAREDADNK